MLRTAVRFGLFVLISGALTLWLVFTIGNIRLFEDRYTLTATFDDVTGLLPADNVKIAGVVVGKVTDIDVVSGRARVRMEIDDDVRLPADTRAQIRWRNLLGQRYVYLLPGDASTTLTPGSEITDTDSVVDLGELFNRLGPIVAAIEPAKVNEFLDAVVGALDGNEDKVRSVIDDLALISEALGSRDRTVGRLIANLDTVVGTIATRDAQIRTLLDNLVTLSATFSDNTDTLERAVDELGDFSGHMGAILTDQRTEIDNLLANLAVVADALDRKRPELATLLANLDTASAAVFRAGRNGEWLNQVILCFSDAPPPPGESCATPIVKEESTGAAAVAQLWGVPPLVAAVDGGLTPGGPR